MTHYADQHVTSEGEIDGRLSLGFRLMTMSETAPRMFSNCDAYALMALDGGETGFVIDGGFESFIPLGDVEFPQKPNLTSNPEFWYGRTSRVVRVHHASHRSVAAQVRKYAEMPIEKLEAELGLNFSQA